jgi:hypothetical protein
MAVTRVACPDDSRHIRDERMCLAVISKDVEGELRLEEDEIEECAERDCRTLKTVHVLTLTLTSNRRCEQEQPPPMPDGMLDSRDLTSAFINADGTQRGFHGGHFRWRDAGLLVGGTLSGITNAGTHRPPFDPACQDCYAPGFMEGRFCGLIRRAPQRALIGCNVIGIYKLRLPDPSNTGGGGRIQGVMEGVIVCGCD